jgi:hypothetical protein
MEKVNKFEESVTYLMEETKASSGFIRSYEIVDIDTSKKKA